MRMRIAIITCKQPKRFYAYPRQPKLTLAAFDSPWGHQNVNFKYPTRPHSFPSSSLVFQPYQSSSVCDPYILLIRLSPCELGRKHDTSGS
jgi:hypothetical protein